MVAYGKCLSQFLWFAVALVLLNAAVTYKPESVTNSAIESSPVIAVNAVTPVYSTLGNALNRFTFFASLFDQYVCGFCGTADFSYCTYS